MDTTDFGRFRFTTNGFAHTKRSAHSARDETVNILWHYRT